MEIINIIANIFFIVSLLLKFAHALYLVPKLIIVNQTLNELKVEKHPDKTFIGRIAKGFDFLGYSFEPKGLSIVPKTLANFLGRMTQLYEQGADHRRIGKRKGKR